MENEGIPQALLSQPEGDRGITIGHDAVGNVLVTGDRNNVQVTLVVADRRLLASLAPVSATTKSTDNPYRGLDAFYETDAAWFFGRAKVVRRAWVLFQNLQRGSKLRILAVVGASGSGKSSLVRAGLLPELVRQPMAGLESPRVLIIRPGPEPLQRLAEVLARLPGTGKEIENRLAKRGEDGTFDALHSIVAALPDGQKSPLVLVVDQFEELYTECDNAETRTAFVENLVLAAANPDRRVSVILTLRSDFAIAVDAPASLAKAVRKNRLMVQAMDRDELREAIERPASELRCPWPPPLAENLDRSSRGAGRRTAASPIRTKAVMAKSCWGSFRGSRMVVALNRRFSGPSR